MARNRWRLRFMLSSRKGALRRIGFSGIGMKRLLSSRRQYRGRRSSETLGQAGSTLRGNRTNETGREVRQQMLQLQEDGESEFGSK
jgi:hypothetical protein